MLGKPQYAACTKQECETKLSTWLRHADSRINGKKKKSAAAAAPTATTEVAAPGAAL